MEVEKLLSSVLASDIVVEEDGSAAWMDVDESVRE